MLVLNTVKFDYIPQINSVSSSKNHREHEIDSILRFYSLILFMEPKIHLVLKPVT